MANMIKVAHVSDVPPGTMKTFDGDGQSILIANWQGTFFATQDLCTHDDGPLGDGELIGDEIECPRHGGRFNIKTGLATQMPAMFPIKTLPVQVKGDDIWVAVE